MEDIAAVRPVHVRYRVPLGSRTNTMVYGYRTGAGRGRRSCAVRGRVVLLVAVIRYHKDVRGPRRDPTDSSLVHVCRGLRRRASLHRPVRPRNHQQEPRADP